MGAIGAAVPLILVPRFTTYAGAGEFTTVPMDLTEYAKYTVTLWRGPLLGQTGAAFACRFEASHDAEEWVQVQPSPLDPPITTVDRSDVYTVNINRRWLRLRTDLTADSSGVAAITLWASGLLERRIG